MTEQKFLSLLSELDPALIEESAPDAPGAGTAGGKRPPSRRTRVLRSALIAAALCALVAAAALWGIPALRRNSGDPITPPGTTEPDGTVEYTPLPLPSSADNAGFPLVFVTGSNASPEGGAAGDMAPPAPKFDYKHFVVRAAVVEVLPDTYCKFTAAPVVRPTEYRLVRFRTLSVLRGEGMPDEFFYLIRASLLADAEKPLTDYDCFWIGMEQIGTDNFVLRNATRGTAEVLPLLLFADSGDQPELGSIIAFSDGVFDETLWQAKSWLFGYQFIRYALENGESAYYELPVARGMKTKKCEAAILALIAEWEKERADRGYPPAMSTVFRLADLTTEEARTAAAYAAPFENGVFAQFFMGGAITYCRFIRGCETGQTIVIHLNDGERVTYSEEKYTPDDLAAAEAIDLPAIITSLAVSYREEAPLPPHLGETDLPLSCLAVTGWYAKDRDGKVCAVVKTIWIYLDREQRAMHYDDSYRLCTAEGIREISRDDLLTAVGPAHVWTHPYGILVAMA